MIFSTSAETITLPSQMAVTVGELQEQLNLPPGMDTSVLLRAIRSAQDEAENFTGLKFVAQTIKCYYNSFPSIGFYLPFGNLISVDHVKYTDSSGDVTTIESTVYEVVTKTELGFGAVNLAYGQAWPSTTLALYNPIEIQFNCGWYRGSTWTATTSIPGNAIVEPQLISYTGFAYSADAEGGTTSTYEPVWPLTIGDTVIDNDITFTCIGRVVPESVRMALLIKSADNYELREDTLVAQGATTTNLNRFKRLLWPYRLRQ